MMSELVVSQGELFFRCFLYGICFGAAYDVFRSVRRAFAHGLFLIAAEDILFTVLWGGQILYLVQIYNGGSLRFFLFLGIVVGEIAYLYTISCVWIWIISHILLFVKKCLKNIKKMLKKVVKTVKIKITLDKNNKQNK